MAEAATKIPAVISSPTTLSYLKHANRHKPFYTPAFSLTKEKWQKTLTQPWLKQTDPLMPPYPYEANPHFPEANYGLYGGSTIQSGNKISKGRNKGKTLRKWFPNIRLEKIRSEALDQTLHIPVRARVMRTIRKCGGLDEYLLGDKPSRIKELGLLGWKLRYLVMKTPAVQQRFKEERQRLGLPDEDPLRETFADVWNNPTKRAKLVAQQDAAWTKMREQVDRHMEHLNRQWGKSNPELDGRELGRRDEALFVREEVFTASTLHERLPSRMRLPDEIVEVDVKGRPVSLPLPEASGKGPRQQKALAA